MATLARQYREMAANAVAEAEATSLENVKKLHLQSAARLNQIAQDLDLVAEAKERNDAVKASTTRD